ncbi:hypothetical protein NPX13_g7217 [Xylaria arbuscula]|uniref:Peptidase C14 caspase domain-containing protein n=1 Tax=Xylaria arbuscula TaxID=114810 RepID=A0A9W8TJE7_9PEZI|nr:hypothetical protein NPX13_g7217 [Xylaria arbuscula]
MASSKDGPVRWALLIGVGVTAPGNGEDPQSDRSLRGAAQDAIAIDEYLKTEVLAVNITMLTATKVDDGPVIKVKETPENLPTFDNVVSSLRRIINLVDVNDEVYIHYSGHGTRHTIDNSVALELIEPATFKTTYLYGTVLRNAIKSMIKKGANVTLVLDCCFSGSVLRDDVILGIQIRYIEYEPEVDRRSKFHDPFAEDSDRMRGGNISLSKFLDPEGYAIITACAPHEITSELNFDGGARRGALSYFLLHSLTTLRKRGLRLSNQIIHQHLLAQFHAGLPGQTPMLFGTRGYAFFGAFAGQPDILMASAHRNRDDGDLILHAGQAHGVHKYDEYTLTPFTTPDDSQAPLSSCDEIRVKVDRPGCLHSSIYTVLPEDLERIKRGSTWQAKLITSFSRRKILVCLGSGVPSPEELACAVKPCSFLILYGEEPWEREENPTIQVVNSGQNTYEVRDTASGRILDNLPNMPQDGNRGEKMLMDTLNHVAKYRFFEGIENQLTCPSFESSFSLRAMVNSEKDGYYVVRHNDDFLLTLENLADRAVYIGVFILTNLWQVRNLGSESGEDACFVVLPKGGTESGYLELPVTMTVPGISRQAGQEQVEDTIKIFISREPLVFPGLMLPRLGRESTLRSGGIAADPLKRFLEWLAELRGVDKREWTTRTYLVRTHT